MKPILGVLIVPIQLLGMKYCKLESVWKSLVSEIQEFQLL